MNIFQLTYKNIRHRKTQASISILLFLFGALLISMIYNMNQQITDKFENNLAGIDLVIGAKGSPLQLVLCNMYHIDAPTGNISVEESKAFFNPRHPLVEMAVPLSLGDSYKGYRIVGTDHSFFDLYDLEIDRGHHWHTPMDAVIGADVARALHLHIGDRFHSSHGLMDDDMHIHEELSFVVRGILQPSSSVADQLILAPAPAVWMVHDHGDTDTTEEDHGAAHESDHHDHEHHAGHDHHDDVDITGLSPYDFNILDHMDKDITSVLVKFKARNFQTLNMQRNINENSSMQAATPAIEVNRIFNLLGFGFELVKYISIALMLVSAVSVFLALLSTLQSRIPELALQRSLGAGRRFLFGQIILEGATIGFLGCTLGILLSKIALFFVGMGLNQRFKYDINAISFGGFDLMIVLAGLLLGALAALAPAIRSYQVEIAKNL